MKIQEKIDLHLNQLPKEKSVELRALFHLIQNEMKDAPLHFFDGLNEQGKVVANPTIGLGSCRLTYKDGRFQDTFRIGISANSTGLSIHILGIKDKSYLKETFGSRLGKAKITGYCIRFTKLADVDSAVLREIVHV
jgi:hypothetical protein